MKTGDFVMERPTLFLVLLVCVLLVGSASPESEEKKQSEAADWLCERALKRWKAELYAEIDNDDKICFKGIESLGVAVSLNDGALKVLSEQRARDKFELTLRSHGVPVSEVMTSGLNLVLSVEAIWDKKGLRSAINVTVAITEPLIFYRDEKPHRRVVVVWESGSYGYAGSTVAKETFLEAIEEKAEHVANLYLSANR